MTKTFVHSRTSFPGAKKAEEVAEVVSFCQSSKIPGKLSITLPGNGGITSVVFEGKDDPVQVVPEENV